MLLFNVVCCNDFCRSLLFKMLFFLMVASFIISLTRSNRCAQDSASSPPQYYLIEKCYRSTLGILATANFHALASCQKLAVEKKGLALNFSPPEVGGSLLEGEETPLHTCEVLKCAESEIGLSLVNDTRYDYYSLYSRPLPNVNATCVPGIGMLTLLRSLNYTEAETECRNRSGSLADFMSEHRTDALALMLVGSGIDVAFVGARSYNGSAYMGVSGDSLDCVTYRAWAPGHPKRNRTRYGCVGITKVRTWRSIPCSAKITALCEHNPGGPYERGSVFAARRKYENETGLIEKATSVL